MFDFRQDTPEELRLRSGVLPKDADKKVYVIEPSDKEAAPEETTNVHY
jgi:hypothetical protein